MILNSAEIAPEIRKRGMEIAGEIFPASVGPDQMQATEENFQKLKSLNPNSILYDIRDGEIAGWAVVVPTSRELMEKFVNREIGEQAVLDLAEKQDSYPALYVCAAAVVPAYRRRGVAMNLVQEAIARMPLEPRHELYAWTTSPEGVALIEKLQQQTGTVVRIRS